MRLVMRSTMAAAALAATLAGQQAISTRAGLVQRVEGHAQVSDLAPEDLPTDTFVHLRPGQRMRTLRGRAEVVLAPGVYARFNAYSEIELISQELSDVRIRLVEGALVIDAVAGKPGRDYNVAIHYGDLVIRPERRGEYELTARRDAAAELRVHDGRAIVQRGVRWVRAARGKELPLDRAGWGEERELTMDEDGFRFRLIDWSRRRRAELAAAEPEVPRWTRELPLEELGWPPPAPTGPPEP